MHTVPVISPLLIVYTIAVADLGFLKGGFCSAEQCNLSSARSREQKKSLTFTTHFFQPAFLSFSLTQYFLTYKTTVIEYLHVTAIRESRSDCSIRVFDLTTQYIKSQRGGRLNLPNPF